MSHHHLGFQHLDARQQAKAAIPFGNALHLGLEALKGGKATLGGLAYLFIDIDEQRRRRRAGQRKRRGRANAEQSRAE